MCRRAACGRPGKPVKAKRATPRRGRVIDRARMDWAATQPCQVTGQFPATTHHVRSFGGPKDDRRIIRLTPHLHMHGFGNATVEHGKAQFEAAHGRKIEDMVAELQERYSSMSSDSTS